MRINGSWLKRRALAITASLAIGAMAVTSPAMAQMETIDPNEAIDADLMDPQPSEAAQAAEDVVQSADDAVAEGTTEAVPADAQNPDVAADGGSGDALPGDPNNPDGPAGEEVANDGTYQKDDLIGAAEGVFGKGAEGLAGVIEDILKDQGEPNGYIVGREAGGALVVGLRYGSGKLYHKVEGERDVYWTGPSIGFDAGANAAKSFTLVYNLYDTEDLFKRYGSGEGAAYFVGGFNVSYLRRGDVVLIPVHLGAGVRLGANVGYRKFSKKQRWLPF
ncbi:EipA family protein [Parasphingorhabdus sp. SCSIO 66989]|uniref:EipA family protein n=2 Tax=Alterisphingorhabdus coralli TaxID=3071408 RepID=A0AA97F964_9SPHN|nr:EipA family protein [Parasphingorhabdus sp. SCSIO 66989]WOE76704.1 EipA family protein [Parasphingorhabdus sp. SCSIO 66989]